MNPFQILGVPLNCSVDDAKAAWRKLAQSLHPDKGGNEEAFKRAKAAWEQIEGGYRYEAPAPPPKSSFSSGTAPPPKAPEKPRTAQAGKPAPGYEARRTRPVLPRTKVEKRYGETITSVDIEITEIQAFTGCTVPFWDNGTVHDFVVRSGRFPEDCTQDWEERVEFPIDEMIGRTVGSKRILVRVHVKPPYREPPTAPEDEEETKDAEMTLPLCALGLFTGGKVTVNDPREQPIQVTIPPGHDPSTILRVPHKGYGPLGARGALLIRIMPIFKVPSTLNEHELRQLQRLNEMTK